jgi:hypothetical protein
MMISKPEDPAISSVLCSAKRARPLKTRVDKSNDHQKACWCLSIVLLAAPQFFLFER